MESYKILTHKMVLFGFSWPFAPYSDFAWPTPRFSFPFWVTFNVFVHWLLVIIELSSAVPHWSSMLRFFILFVPLAIAGLTLKPYIRALHMAYIIYTKWMRKWFSHDFLIHLSHHHPSFIIHFFSEIDELLETGKKIERSRKTEKY